MDVTQLSELVVEFDYVLGRISKYRKHNQYVYLGAFNSWIESYNSGAEKFNANESIIIPLFKLSPVDYSPTGKSIRVETVDKFIKLVNQQILRLEEEIKNLHREAALQLAMPHPLTRFFLHDNAGKPCEPSVAESRVVVAIPGVDDEQKIFRQGIQPVLEAEGLSCFKVAHSPLGDDALGELCRELYACRLAIFDLTGQASNVMLALGLAYGIGKPVVLLLQQGGKKTGGSNNEDYLIYAGVADLKKVLGTKLISIINQS